MKEPERYNLLMKKDGITIRATTEYIAEDKLDGVLSNISDKFAVNTDSVIVQNIGTEEEFKEGKLFFCPYCGGHSEYGYENSTFYGINPNFDNPSFEVAIRLVTIDCPSCERTFSVQEEKNDED